MKRTYVLSSLALLCAGQALAQASIDPLLLQKQERDNQRRNEERERLLSPPRRAVEPPPRPAVQPTAADVKFRLTAVDFAPSVFFTPEELQAMAAPYVGTEVDFSVINGLVDAVNARYAARGQAFARALLPPQRVDNGRIRINLVEAKADSVDVEGLAHVSRAWIDSLVATRPGEVVDALRLDRSIDRFQRGSEARFAIDVEPGQTPGTSSLKIKVAEPPRLKLRAGLNNEGNDVTGREQATADLSLFSPLGRGDRAGMSLVAAKGLKNLGLSYSVPVSAAWGTRLGLGAAVGRTRIVEGAFAPNDIESESRSWNLQVVQPVYDARPWSVEALLSYGSSRSETSIAGVSLGPSKVRQYSAGLQVSRRNEASEWAALLNWVPYRSTAPAGLTQESAKVEWSTSYVQRFEGLGALLARANGQHSRSANPLAGVGQLSMGGAGLLRAYPAGSLIGDSGYGLAVEWHGAITPTLGWNVFAERGQVWGGVARASLTDVGAGLEWRATDKVVFNATVAHALNQGPLGSSSNRLYFRISGEF